MLPAKAGELLALDGVSPLRKGEEIQPMVILQKEIPASLLKRLIKSWSTHDKFYIDPHSTDAIVAAKFLDLTRGAGLQAIPVAAPNNSQEKIEVIRRFLKGTDPAHVAIRLPADLAAAKDCERRLGDLLNMLGVGPEHVDLFVDFGYIRESYRFHQANVARVFELLPGFDDWRSIRYAASSFPEALREAGNYEEPENGIFRLVLPRVEFDTHQSLCSAGFSRPIGFSDTAVTFAEPPDTPAPPFRPTVNLRYTVADSFMILMGVYDNENEDMVRVCEALVAMPEFRGENYSAGDAAIFHCAKTRRDHGQSQQWRKWDINHHFEETMDRVPSSA